MKVRASVKKMCEQCRLIRRDVKSWLFVPTQNISNVKDKFMARLKRKGKSLQGRKVPKGVVHVQASFNNTIVTITDPRGGVLSWSSAGACGFRGAKKATPFAAQTATETAIQECMDLGMNQVDVILQGPGAGRETTVRALQATGIMVCLIQDITSVPHNGCRPPKKRRI